MDWLVRAISGPEALLFAGAIAAVLLALNVALIAPVRAQYGQAPPETRIGCTPAELAAFLGRVRARGARGLIVWFLLVDLGFAGMYGLLLPSVVGRAALELLGSRTALNLFLLPFVAAVADVAENITLLALHARARDGRVRRAVVWICARVLTSAKFLAFVSASLVVAGGTAWWALGAVTR
ncbi:MAG TPA: hypothetical protein VGB83_11745 [Actinomycetota bacterium]